MKIGPIEISFSRKKGYSDLERTLTKSFQDTKSNPSRQLREYKSWVSSATSLISRRLSSLDYKLYKIGTDEEINSRNHSFRVATQSFVNPNQLMTFRFMKSWCQIQLDLCGMAAILKVRNKLGEVRELWPLNMNNFVGAYDAQGMPIEMSTQILPTTVIYVFQYSGKLFPVSINDMMLLMYPHPTCLFMGASPIQSQAYAIDTQTYIEIYERDFFANSARVDMVLASDNELGETLAKQIKERWLEKFNISKGGKFHDIAVLEKGVKPIPMTWTNKDFEFLALANWTKEMVLGAYGINPSKLGISEGVNRSNSVYVDIDFNREVIAPRLKIWDDEMTSIVQEVNQILEIRHLDPIPRDRQIEVQESRVYLAGQPSYTINEWRKIKGLSPQKGGDIIYVKKDLIPLEMLEEFSKKELEGLNKPTLGNGGSPTDMNETDPERHENDDPKLNPDGTDDRDSQPTEGRSISFDELELKLKNIWYKTIDSNIVFGDIPDMDSFIEKLVKVSIKSLFLYTGKQNVESEWINEYSKKFSNEFCTTFKSDTSFDVLHGNGRIQKLIANGTRACCNFVKNTLLENEGREKIWIVVDNFCGHLARVKNFKSKDFFEIGGKKFKFPLESISLNCNCKLDY